MKSAKSDKIPMDNLIRTYRKKAKISQQELGDRLGVSRNTVLNWEAGKYRPDIDLLPHMCELFGISLYQLFGIENNSEDETMWVMAKEKTQLSAISSDIIITHSVQAGSKWLAFHEPDLNMDLPWRVNHKHLNIRVNEERFRELFEEIQS